MEKTRWYKMGCAALLCTALVSCSRTTGEGQPPVSTDPPAAATPAEAPSVPDGLDLVDGVPMLRVYLKEQESYREMDIETYIEGVLAGEMRSDWPMEALKAQAVLARTFALKFVSEKESKYEGADISTDIAEAQAYNESAVNERIRRAVQETKGIVLSCGGELPYAWFHAHSGGMTELAAAGLEYPQEEPAYTHSVEGMESDKAPTVVKNWTARFTAREVGEACARTGIETGPVESISIGEKSASGRALTLVINGMNISAPQLRLQLDSTRLKSAMLTEAVLQDGEVVFRGRGYGHGVGMSQWGAYHLAEQGGSAEEIILHYFRNTELVRLWG